MDKSQFKIQLKPGITKQALAFVLAYDKRFTGKRRRKSSRNSHRFLWSTGIEVPRRGFDPARPGIALKRLLKVAETALESLEQEGTPVNYSTLKSRIELIRNRMAWTGNELSIWNGSAVEVFTIPDVVDRLELDKAINQELLKQRQDFKRAVDKVVSGGSNELFRFFQDVISGKVKPRNGKNLRPATIRAKKQTQRALLEYQDYLGKPITFESMNRDFYNRFTLWLKVKKEYDDNSQGKIIKDLKALLHLAKANEIISDDRFSYWKVIRERNEVVTLSKEELLKITDLQQMKIFDQETGEVVEVRALSDTEENVRDIFVLSCHLGLRIGDYKQFKPESLSTRAGVMFFSYVQEKTGKLVEIPVHDVARKILDKRNGEFPRMISEQNFRYCLKDICRAAGLNDRVITKIRDGKAVYKKKWEAISPHSARRTFASNLFYGWFGKPMPASLCMRYTGHKSEKSFMLYIGATDEQLNEMALQYFDFAKPVMTAV